MNRRAFLASLPCVAAAPFALQAAEPARPERTRHADVVAFKKDFGERVGYRHDHSCPRCRIVPYDEVIGTWRNPPPGMRAVPEFAGFAVACAAHDGEHVLWPWLEDVPDEAIARQFDFGDGAFSIDSLAEYLPDGHPHRPEPRPRRRGA